nr:hypothetical protein [uncultured Duganella sp.]
MPTFTLPKQNTEQDSVGRIGAQRVIRHEPPPAPAGVRPAKAPRAMTTATKSEQSSVDPLPPGAQSPGLRAKFWAQLIRMLSQLAVR